MTFRRLPLLIVLLALGLPLVRAERAHAGEGEAAPTAASKDYVSQLTKEEHAFLREKIQGWDKLDSAKKQRIAHNVLRIRRLEPKQRKAFEEKLGRLREHAKRGDGRRKFHDHATTMLVNRALAQEARRRLGREFEGRVRRKDISQHAFEMAFSGKFWRKVAERTQPVAPDALPPEFPEGRRQHYAKTYAEYAKATDEKKRTSLGRRLSFKLSMLKGEQIRRRLQQTDLRGEAYVAAVGAAVRKEYGEAFDETVKDSDALLQAAERVEVKRGIHRLIQRAGRLDRDESGLLLALVNRWVTQNAKGDAELGSAGDAVLRALLVKELKMTAEEAAQLPPAAEAEARAAYLQRILRRRFGGRMRPSGRDGRGSRGSRDGRPGAPGRGMRRPEGLSDTDWAVWTKAFEAARADGSVRAMLQLLREKPTGLSDEGYELLRRSVRKMGPRRGGKPDAPGPVRKPR